MKVNWINHFLGIMLIVLQEIVATLNLSDIIQIGIFLTLLVMNRSLKYTL